MQDSGDVQMAGISALVIKKAKSTRLNCLGSKLE